MKKIDDMEGIYLGSFKLARAEMGVTAFGMAVMDIPAGYGDYPEHDHSEDGQEEVYIALSGSATLHADGEDHLLEPGVFARVGPGVRRKITTGDEPVQILALGGTPGQAYSPWPFSELGASRPG